MGHCADCGCPIDSLYPLCLPCGHKESGEMDARDQRMEDEMDALDMLDEMSNDDDYEGGDDEKETDDAD